MHGQVSGACAPAHEDQTPGAAVPVRSRLAYLGEEHPLASVARDRCRLEHPRTRRRMGGVACGRCWEQAIRADERVVVELGLPAEPVADPELVDEVAVDRACAGEAVRLSKAERRAALLRLAGRGLSSAEAVALLAMRGSSAEGEVAA